MPHIIGRARLLSIAHPHIPLNQSVKELMTELDPHLHTRINRFCEIGDALAEDGKYSDAVVSYQYAWNLLPDPKENWEAATWI